MDSHSEIKEIVKKKYAEIAKSNSSCCEPSASSCCNSNNNLEYSVIGDDYNSINGYVAEADLGLGCGIPTQYAGINKGDIVVDLGSGAGNDVFIARSIVGDEGFVIGIDMTEEMISKAEKNKSKLGYTNVKFLLGEIENLPIEDNYSDVVVSNCVLNLVPDKQKGFSEIHRILKPGGHFCVSDIVFRGEMTEELKKSAVLYAGCVSGASTYDEYLSIIKSAGFRNIEIHKKRKIDLPEDLLKKYLSKKGLEDFKNSINGIFSITVSAVK